MSAAREFLAAVQQRASAATYHGGLTQEVADDALDMHAALTAALDLHREEVSCGNQSHTNFDVGCPECLVVCDSCGEVYPCPTVRAITAELTAKESDS